MFGKYLSLLVAFSIGACANPKYVSANNGPSEKPSGACVAKFTSGECVDLTWEKKPTDSDFGVFVFKIFRPNLGDGSPVPVDMDGAVSVLLWMPSMGHSSSPVTVVRVDVGTYRVTNVFFTMKGEWEIHFQIKDGAAVRNEAILPVSL